MASEIRVDTLKTTSGLGTVTFGNNGAVLSGIVTATTFNAANFTGNIFNGNLNSSGISTVGNININGTTNAITGVSSITDNSNGYLSIPPGTVLTFAASTAPSGYLKCNGAAISRSTYSDLFARLGTLYGSGNGSTTFNVPDLRGEFIRGWDDSRGVDIGRVFASAQSYAVESHKHGTNVDGHNLFDASSGSIQVPYGGAGTYPGTNFAMNHYGGTETRPRNIALLHCIKY